MQYYLFCKFLFGKKRKNIFSNFSIFAFFCSNIFFFYIFWCMENYKSILLLSLPLFTCPTFIPFSTLSLLPFSMGFGIINEALTSFQLKITILNNFCYPSSMSGFFWYILVVLLRSYTKSFFRQEFSPSQSLTTFRVCYKRS